MVQKEEKSGSGESSRQAVVPQLLLTIKETARLLRLSEAKVYSMLEYRHPGGIPIKRFGKSVRVSVSELRRWLDEQ
jgi:excisionase family DNA binding protein